VLHTRSYEVTYHRRDPLEIVVSEIKETVASELLICNKEEDEECIAPLMSSFFSSDDEDDDASVQATAAIVAQTMDIMHHVAAVAVLEDPKIQTTHQAAKPSAIMMAEEKAGSTKPATTDDMGKGPIEIEDAKKAIEDETPLGEGPFDQEFRGRRYRVHHLATKVMGAKQLVEAIGFTEQLGYPSGSTIFRGEPKDYLYCCPDSLVAEVCRYMADNIGFPKLEDILLMMPSKDFFRLPSLYTFQGMSCVDFFLYSRILKYCITWLTFLTLQGLILSKTLKNRKNIEGEAAQKEVIKHRSEVSELCFDYAEQEKAF
jgi:hypothetical protein